MKAKQKNFLARSNAPYGQIYDDTKSMILSLSEMTEVALEDAATELGSDFEVFILDYHGPCFVDGYVGFVGMLRQWPTPWPSPDADSALHGLTVAQIFLSWAWEGNNTAKCCLDGDAIAKGWKPKVAAKYGVAAAVSAAKSLLYAKSLMARGENSFAQEVLATPQPL